MAVSLREDEVDPHCAEKCCSLNAASTAGAEKTMAASHETCHFIHNYESLDA